MFWPADMSVNALAKTLGIPQSALSDMLNGKRDWSKSVIIRLSAYFALQPGVEQTPAVPRVGDVAGNHLGALLDEAMDHPGPEAAQRAGDEKAFGHVFVGCSGSRPARA